LHVALIGVGRVGQVTAFSLIHEHYIDELTLVDVAPKLTWAISEEMQHARTGMHLSIQVNALESVRDISDADIIIVAAGRAASQGMSRRELVGANAKIVREIAETVPPRNHGARYVIVTNPVDAMATLFKKVSKENYVVSSGCNLDSLRLRAEIAKQLRVPQSTIEGYVGGEHGDNDVYLWSTVHVAGDSFDEACAKANLKISKNHIIDEVHEIVDSLLGKLGGTMFGPAISFREIIRAIALNTNSLLSIGTPYQTAEIPEPVYISIPLKLGMSIGPTIENSLFEEERTSLREAAKAVYRTYSIAAESSGLDTV
jgi:malate dehydrogenase